MLKGVKMLKDITGVRLLGANFDKVTDILMLDTNEGNTRKNVKGCLLYGRNGAGKSTIAKAIKKAKGEIQDSIIQSEFLDVNNSPIVLNEEENARVFVFDEEYIDKNIKETNYRNILECVDIQDIFCYGIQVYI